MERCTTTIDAIVMPRGTKRMYAKTTSSGPLPENAVVVGMAYGLRLGFELGVGLGLGLGNAILPSCIRANCQSRTSRESKMI